MNRPHLDDEQLSAHLDGVALDERDQFHLQGCADCAGRRRDLAAASEAVAAPVAPLDAAVVEALVARAVSHAGPGSLPAPAAPGAGGGVGTVVNLDARRRTRRRPAGPPRAWMTGVAAALVVLAGLATFLQTTSSRDDPTTAFTGNEDSAAPAPRAETAGGAGPSSAAAAMFDPAVVAGDLGDQDDPALLVVALSASVRSERVATATPAQTGAATAPTTTAGQAQTPAEGSAAPQRDAHKAAAAPAQDRAMCVEAAREIGAGRLGGHVSTSTLRWKGRAAEVLVFELTEPAGGVSLQALVLSRPGCALLADPRF